MSSSFVVCLDCGESSAAIEWGFVLLARHGWSAQLGETGSEPEWRCPSCNAKAAAQDDFHLTLEEAPSNRRLRVLLVDDQVLVLRATASMLRELDVVTVVSAAEALRRLGDGTHYDVVVSDVSMPEMSGPELFVRVRQRFPHLAERFLLRPEWAPPGDDPRLTEIALGQGPAFGTGLHPTTQACLATLAEVEPGGSLADCGCGSGVLSIAAAKLG